MPVLPAMPTAKVAGCTWSPPLLAQALPASRTQEFYTPILPNVPSPPVDLTHKQQQVTQADRNSHKQALHCSIT